MHPCQASRAERPRHQAPRLLVRDAAACRDPKNHRYSPAAGLPELRDAIAAKTARDSGWQVEARQVLVTNGGKQAVFEAFATLIDPDDEVLLPAPYWTTYPEAVRMAGGNPVVIGTDESTEFLPTVEALDAARTPRTKALLWCSPSNPTGSVAPRELVEAVFESAEEEGVVDTYVHYLRRKLGRGVVATVRGLGYRLGSL